MKSDFGQREQYRELHAAERAYDLRAYLRRTGRAVEESGGGENVYVSCPRCGRPKFYISLVTYAFQCFRCELKGGLAQLLMLWEGWTWFQAKVHIMGEAAAHPAPPRVFAVRDAEVALPSGMHLLDDEDNERTRRAWRYLTRRRVAPDLIRAYGMGYCRFGACAGRVVIPVVQGGVLKSWVARDITGASRTKTLTPAAYPPGVLFNLDVAARADTVVITEGVFDALRLPDRSVATFGKKISQAQVRALARAGVERVVFAWDGDAWAESARAAWTYAPFFRRTYAARVPEGMDPSDMAEADLRDLVRYADRASGSLALEAEVALLGKPRRKVAAL